MTQPTIGHRTTTEFMSSPMDCGKPLDCIGIPLSVQVGKHDFVKLTPQEAQGMGFILEEGDPTKAHIGDKYIDPKDWTKTKVDVCVPVYTDLEASLLASLRQVRNLLVPIRLNLINKLKPDSTTAEKQNAAEIGNALAITHSILSDHEVHS